MAEGSGQKDEGRGVEQQKGKTAPAWMKGGFIAVCMVSVAALIGHAASQKQQPGAQTVVSRIPTREVSRIPAAIDPSQPIPKNLGRSEMLSQAQSALAQGIPDRALEIVYGSATADMLRDDSEVKALIAQANSALRIKEGPMNAEGFVEQIDSYALPELKAIPMTPPDDQQVLWDDVRRLDDLAQFYMDGMDLPLDAKGKQARADFLRALRAKQVSLFPILRRAYGKIVGSALWEHDIAVRVGGLGDRTITWTAGIFAAHSNIAEAQQDAASNLLKLRFTRSAYEWARGIGDVNTYTMTPPADGAVGRWDGTEYIRAQ